MNGGTRIIAFDSAGSNADEDEILLTQEVSDHAESAPDWYGHDEAAPPADPRSGRITWLLGGILLVGWTAFFAWAVRDQVTSGLPPAEWIGLIRDWAVPVMLGALAALVLLRNSRREAIRFGDAARLLAAESANLGDRLTVVNRELSLAREFIAAQSRDLETLGRLAADKLSTEADRLQGLIRDNHARVEAIGTVSTAALDNMEKLRGQLPVIASSAKDVTNNIANAGRTAHSQLQEMINGFRKLNEFGQASERQVQVLRELVDTTSAEFTRQAEQFGDIATQRFAALRESGEDFRTQLERHEVEALASIRSRASAMADELEQTREALNSGEAESLTSMRARLSALREEGASISRALRDGERRALEGWQAGIVRLKDELQSALAALEDAEIEAAAGTRSRIAAIGDELAALERQSADRATRFAVELDERRAQAATAEEAAAARMREHLSALDDAEAERKLRHGEIDRELAAELRERLAEFEHEIGEREARLADLDAAAIGTLRDRLASIDSAIAARLEQHRELGERIVAQVGSVTERLDEFEARVASIAQHGERAEAALGESLQTLADRLADSRNALGNTDAQVAALTDSSVRLLELIQASVKHSAEELPAALGKGEVQLSQIESRMNALREAAAETDDRGAHLASTIDGASGTLRQTYAELARLQAELERGGTAHGATLGELRQELDAITTQTAQVTEETRSRLAAALDGLARSAKAAVADFGESGSAAVSALARQIGSESATAIERAMRTSASETAGLLEEAVTQAATASRDAALQMRDQLAKVNELAANLENRVTHARQRAEEQVDNDFTRRIALITESLNSNSIDIAKALSTDVADTAWAAYLRGDRGIFTRRAVSLVDSADAKAIVQIYERDREFHEHVSRYIHDFEAMLRQVLSARDGQALGVTLLSSDMGKLYVALAQAIERLRK